MIISTIGRMGSGKDLTAKAIQFCCWNYLQSSIGKSPDSDFESWLIRDENPVFHKHHIAGNYVVRKWAGKLKQIVSILTGIPVEDLEKNEVKNRVLGDEWDIEYSDLTVALCNVEKHEKMTVRKLLQKVGTDAMRDRVHENIWVNALMSSYTKECNWIISDTRFENEAQAIKSRGGIIIRCNRKTDNISTHISETALDSYKADYEVDNNGTKEYLVEQVKAILEKEGII